MAPAAEVPEPLQALGAALVVGVFRDHLASGPERVARAVDAFQDSAAVVPEGAYSEVAPARSISTDWSAINCREIRFA